MGEHSATIQDEVAVAIYERSGTTVHSTAWSHEWIALCQSRGIKFKVVDCFRPGTLDIIRPCDILLFHFGNYTRTDMLFARSVLYSAKAMGLGVFPDFPDAWHFDDKIAQSYLLSAIGAPVPGWQVFYSKGDFQAWLETNPDFPLVAKLKTGSGSHNVKLLRGNADATTYGSKMFGRGFDASPNVGFKISSNLRSSKSLGEMWSRLKRGPEFLRTLRQAKEFDRERGYVFLQDFIENDGYDIKVAVVNGKVSYLCRRVRKGDFRASGGADLFYDRDLVPDNVVQSAFKTASDLGSTCMGFDYVVDSKTGQGVIVEMSYGFNHGTILDAGGHWDGDGVWRDEPLNAPAEILDHLMAERAAGNLTLPSED